MLSSVKGVKSHFDLTYMPFSFGTACGATATQNCSIWPQLEFPWFDGSSPKICKIRCEKIFEIYGVHSNLWIILATMHFMNPGSFLLEAIESQLVDC